MSPAELVLIALLFGVLVFLALEMSARAFQTKRLGAGSRAAQALRDRFVAWRNNPAFGRPDIQHNAQGFRRGVTVSLGKPNGTVRIFLLGGSTAYGAQGGFAHIDNRYARIYNHQLIDAYLEVRLNEAFPLQKWEVINAAASGYRIHQQLALIQSRILRYRPNCVICMDGYNDFIELYHGAQAGPRAEFDVYENTPGQEEFDALANPHGLRSLRAFANSWLRNTSVLYRLAQDRVPGAVRNPWGRRSTRAQGEFREPVQLIDLSDEERLGATLALNRVSYYTRTARQIHRVLELDGVKPVFLLQPILILSHKPFTPSEQRMFDYDRTLGGPLYCFLFRQIYSEIARSMAEAAQQDGLLFVNLENVFDQTAEQTFSDFAHLTPDGNRVVAEALFRFLTGRVFPPDTVTGQGAQASNS